MNNLSYLIKTFTPTHVCCIQYVYKGCLTVKPVEPIIPLISFLNLDKLSVGDYCINYFNISCSMKGGISILVHWKYMVGLKIKPRTPATLARSSTTELLWLISMVHIHVATTNTEQSFTKRFYFNLWKNSPIFIVLLLALFIRKPNIEKYDISLNKKEIRSLVSNGHPITLQPPEQQI